MSAFLAGRRAEVFPDQDYADLFAPPGVGRPSVPATQMAAVMTPQALHDYSDRESAEAVRFDVRWKVAIGASLDDPGFDPSTLVYWRQRLAESGRPHRVGDAVKKVVEQTGILKGRRRRAVDSTILADAVATQDTVTQLVSAVRRVARHTLRSSEARRNGYRAHLVADPQTGIITDEKLTRASGEEICDPAVAAEFLAAEHGQDAYSGPAPSQPHPLARRPVGEDAELPQSAGAER